MKKNEFYVRLQLYLKLTDVLYSNYIESEKKFIYTKILRKYNGLILNLILDNPEFIIGKDFNDFINLIEHLSVWTEEWDHYFEKHKPGINDIFVFENKSIFPREFSIYLSNLDLSSIKNKK